jgi:hypothetical protein
MRLLTALALASLSTPASPQQQAELSNEAIRQRIVATEAMRL